MPFSSQREPNSARTTYAFDRPGALPPLQDVPMRTVTCTYDPPILATPLAQVDHGRVTSTFDPVEPRVGGPGADRGPPEFHYHAGTRSSQPVNPRGVRTSCVFDGHVSAAFERAPANTTTVTIIFDAGPAAAVPAAHSSSAEPTREPSQLELLQQAYGLFNLLKKLYSEEQPVLAAAVVMKFIAHRFTQDVFEKTCPVAVNIWSRRIYTRDDVLFEATRIVVARLFARTIKYKDKGPLAFANWLPKVCRSACAAALERFERHCRTKIVPVDPRKLARRAAEAECEHPRDRLHRVVKACRDPDIEKIISDLLEGCTIAECAAGRGITPSAFVRLRDKAFARLQKLANDLE